MWHIAAAVTLVTQGACKLEDDMFCDFANAHCHFNYSDLRDADHHSAFMDLISKPLRATAANRDCSPLPDATRNFTISIEPCFTDFSTGGVPANEEVCPDVGIEYYKENGRIVTTLIDTEEGDTIPADISNNAYISGDPVEFHIANIGRHYVYNMETEKHGPYTGANTITNGLTMKGIKFRTLPMNKHDFNIMNKDLDHTVLPNGNQCPLEVNFADDRTAYMSLSEQYKNIYVMTTSYYADLGGSAVKQGRGCYMCYKTADEDSYVDSLKKNQDNWLKQYHDDCILDAFEYGAAYDPIAHEDIFSKINDIKFKRNVYAGVYTLYPYIDIPNNVKGPALEQLLNKQLRMILDPGYHVTVEIVGMSKRYGSRPFRNLHGRIIEKNLVTFEPVLKSLHDNLILQNAQLSWTDPEDDSQKFYYTPRPNKCLISFADYGTAPPTEQPEVLICKADLDTKSVKEHPFDPVRIDIHETATITAFDQFTDPTKETTDVSNLGADILASLKNPFAEDYCFHKPAVISTTIYYVTACTMFNFAGNCRNVGVSMFMKTFDATTTVCDYDRLLHQLNQLNNMEEFRQNQAYQRSKLQKDPGSSNPPIDFDCIDFPEMYVCDPICLPSRFFVEDTADWVAKHAANLTVALEFFLDINKYVLQNKNPNVDGKDPNVGGAGALCQAGFARNGDGNQPKYLLSFVGPPVIVKPKQECPFEAKHGQVRMVPSSNYTIHYFNANETCPPDPCGKQCVSLFTNTPYFRDWITTSVAPPQANLPQDTSLPIHYLDLKDSQKNYILKSGGPYQEYCTKLKNSIKKESNSVQPFSCSSETVEIRARQNVPNATYGMKGNSDWVEDTPIPYAYLGQTDFVGLHPGLQELYDMFQYPSIKSIFPEWSILVYEQYIKDFIPGLLWRYSGVSCISPDFRLKDHLPDIWDCSPAYYYAKYGSSDNSFDNWHSKIEHNKFCGIHSNCQFPVNSTQCPGVTSCNYATQAYRTRLMDLIVNPKGYEYGNMCVHEKNGKRGTTWYSKETSELIDPNKRDDIPQMSYNITNLAELHFSLDFMVGSTDSSHEPGECMGEITESDLSTGYYSFNANWHLDQFSIYNKTYSQKIGEGEIKSITGYDNMKGDYDKTLFKDVYRWGMSFESANSNYFLYPDPSSDRSQVHPNPDFPEAYSRQNSNFFLRVGVQTDERYMAFFVTGDVPHTNELKKEFVPAFNLTTLALLDEEKLTLYFDIWEKKVVAPPPGFTQSICTFKYTNIDLGNRVRFPFCWGTVAHGWRTILHFCSDYTLHKKNAETCDNFVYTADFYGIDSDPNTQTPGATWSYLGATKPTFVRTVEQVVAESNIIGITVEAPAFSSMVPLQFPGGIIINSTHPLIHTRIQRALGETSGDLASINCNVVQISTPNIHFHNVEFDNTACQEAALNLAASHTDSNARNARAFKFFKGWNFAAFRLTNAFSGTTPTNIQIIDAKFTSAVSFRKTFPGRPLVSVDNTVRKSGYVDVGGLYISNANDTFDYTIVVNATQSVPLAPLDMIMWNYKGRVDFGYFAESWEVVSYAEGGAQNTTELYYSTAADKLVSFDRCNNITSDIVLLGGVLVGNSSTLGNDTYCKQYGGQDCTFVAGACVQNPVTTADNLQILVSYYRWAIAHVFVTLI